MPARCATGWHPASCGPGGVRLQLCRTWAQKLRFHRRQIANGRHVSDGRISYANCQFSALAAGRRPGILNKQDLRLYNGCDECIP